MDALGISQSISLNHHKIYKVGIPIFAILEVRTININGIVQSHISGGKQT